MTQRAFIVLSLYQVLSQERGITPAKKIFFIGKQHSAHHINRVAGYMTHSFVQSALSPRKLVDNFM
jgi:hypothetical protein